LILGGAKYDISQLLQNVSNVCLSKFARFHKLNLTDMQSKAITISKFGYNWLLMFIVWYGFTTTFALQEVITGVIVSFAITMITARVFQCCGLDILLPHKLFYIIQYIFVFIIALIKANFDVAKRVISPKLPINPGIVEFETELTNDFAKMLLANSITLTPGTLTVDLVGNKYYIHWIDVKTEDPEQARKEIAGDFEKVLKKIFN
jgi:multicomponent Na+:H+ antiporter subunit E